MTTTMPPKTQTTTNHRSYKSITRITLRALQLFLATVIAAIYGADLAHATKSNLHAHAEWIYAEFVVTVSALTCLGYLLASKTHPAWSAWDAVVLVLWLALVGVFGSSYISGVEEKYEIATTSVSRMKAAVWIDLVNMFLWLVSMLLGIVWGCRARRGSKKEKEDEQKGSCDVERGFVVAEKEDLSDWVDEKAGLKLADEKRQSQGEKGEVEDDV